LTFLEMKTKIKNMQATISLKMPQDLVTRLKKASRIRGLSMSDLIRQNLQNTYTSDTIKNQEPKIFKYFGVIEDDLELQQFDKDLEKRKKGYKSRFVEL
jgi:metal-responsive CopG/Arc/MetJ family transcriptional regulator